MKVPLSSYLRNRGHGVLEAELALGSEPSKPRLCLTTLGLWLVTESHHADYQVDDLLSRELRYERSSLKDKLHVGTECFSIPLGRGKQVRALVARARLRGAGAPRELYAPLALAARRHVVGLGRTARWFLEATLEPQELVLGWLPSARAPEATTLEQPAKLAAPYLLVTDRRAALVVLSELGDAQCRWLPRAEVELGNTLGEFVLGGFSWHEPRKRRAEHRDLLALLPLGPAPRLRQYARQLWLASLRDETALRSVRSLLGAALRHEDALSHFLPDLIDQRLLVAGASLERGMQALKESAAPEEALNELRLHWAASQARAEELIVKLTELGHDASPWIVALHRGVHETRLRAAASELERARHEIIFSRHLLRAARYDVVAERVLGQLTKLGTEMPLGLQDANAEATLNHVKIALYEILGHDAAAAPNRELARVNLAQLEPLSAARSRALGDAENVAVAERARHVVRVLEPGGLKREPHSPPPAIRRPLSKVLIDDVLRHALVRSNEPLLSRLQTALAQVPTPDHGVLRDFCERLHLERHARVASALERACRLFGMPAVDLYVSRGQKSVGARSYDGPPAFLLLGGDHLDAATDYYMAESEVGFALGAEIAHLALGHSRVTSSDVWKGAVSKTTEGLGLAFSVIPLLKSLKLAAPLRDALGAIPVTALRQLTERGQAVTQRFQAPSRTPSSDALSSVSEDLVAAHRVMQLTADRAGLLVAADLNSALRAMLLVRRDFCAELPVMQTLGLERYLTQSAPPELQRALTARISQLIAFYLSDDYVRLLSALG